MSLENYDGSKVLEMLAEYDLVDGFYEAIDEDNIPRTVHLMRMAQIDEETILITIKKIQESL